MERLTTEQIADMKEYFSRSKEVKTSSLVMKLSHDGLKLIDTIEAQRQDIESLQRELNAEISVNEALTADKDEQAGRIMKLEDGLKCLHDLLEEHVPVWYLRKHHNIAIDALLGGAEDGK